MAAKQEKNRKPDWIRSKRGEAQRYWDAHPIAVDSVSYQPGTRESFEALSARWSEGIDASRREFLESCRGKRVLEVGCGIAREGRFLVENGVDYRGVDYSLASLRLASAHMIQRGLPARFANADGTSLPFSDGCFDLVFSIGVVHHIPEVARACQEIVRVTAPGGSIRVMVYNRHSYHYLLVRYLVCPVIWLMTRVALLAGLANRGPTKLRDLYEIAVRDGYDRERILSASTDTSSAGEGNYNPLSHFLTEREMREFFSELGGHRFQRSDLKYFPLPFLRGLVEGRWGFFLTMTARTPAIGARDAWAPPTR